MVIYKFVVLVACCVSAISIALCSAVTVVKCCSYDKQLDWNTTECVPLHNGSISRNSTANDSSLENADEDYDMVNISMFWLPEVLINISLEVEIYNKSFIPNHTLKLKESKDTARFNVLSNGSLELSSPTALNHSLKMVYESEEFCMESFAHENGTRERAILVFPCDRVNCVQKCCEQDYFIACRGPRCDCEKSNESNWSLLHPNSPLPTKDFAYEVLYSVLPKCPEHLIPLVANPWAYPEHITRKYWDYPEGRIFTGNVCSEEIWLKGKLRLGLVRCVTKRPFAGIDDLSYGLHIPEVVLLSLSFATILLVPRRRVSVYSYVHDYAMACHAGSLIVRGFLWSISMNTDTTICPYTPMVLYFTSVAASIWLNVICINLAYGFWKPLGLQNSRWGGARAMFACYSLYAWGVSSAMTALTAGMWYAKDVPPNLIRPTLYETRTCYNEEEGEGKYATLAYFYGPVIGLLVVNALLFLSTAFRVSKLRRNTSILDKKRTRPTNKEVSFHNRRSVMVYVKLLWLMGVLEIAMETIAWASDINKYDFAVAASALDVLRAAAIFSLCCCKKSTVRALRHRLRGCGPSCAQCYGLRPRARADGRDQPRDSTRSHTNTDVSVVTDTSMVDSIEAVS